MANIYEPDETIMRGYNNLLEELSVNEREIMEKYPPWKLYRLKSSGHMVEIIAIGTYEDGVKFRVDISGKYNCVMFERQVFGIDPNDLEECDLPDGPTGVLFTEDEDIAKVIDSMKLFKEIKDELTP